MRLYQQCQQRWTAFKTWLEAYKYRNVNLNDPEIVKRIERDQRDTEEYLRHQDEAMRFTWKFCIIFILSVSLYELFKNTVLGKIIWDWITKFF